MYARTPAMLPGCRGRKMCRRFTYVVHATIARYMRMESERPNDIQNDRNVSLELELSSLSDVLALCPATNFLPSTVNEVTQTVSTSASIAPEPTSETSQCPLRAAFTDR